MTSSALPYTPWVAQVRHVTVMVPPVVAAVLALFIALGHDDRRALQVAALALPLLPWVVGPIRSTALHRLRGGWSQQVHANQRLLEPARQAALA